MANLAAPKIAVIVPTFNRRKLFSKALQSVLDQTVKPAHFLILDNHCTDGTAEDLKHLLQTRSSALEPKLHVFHHPENLGASFGMKYLFERALELNPDWVWVMDDDAIATPTALEELLKTQEIHDPETYILESAMVDHENEWSPANRPALFDQARFAFQGLPETAIHSKHPVPVNTGPYCGLLIRKEAFAEFGFPRAEFYLWYDDVEYVLRVSLKKKVLLVPSSRIQHFAQALVPHIKRWPFRAALPQIPPHLLWRYYYLNRNWLWMAKQWMPLHKYAFFWAKHMARNIATPVLLRQTHLSQRWNLALRAGFDALFNKLGKRVSPPAPK